MVNIFATDDNPIICAQNLDDKRVVKMILETAQLISHGMRRQRFTYKPYEHEPEYLLKPFNPTAPVMQWSARSIGNIFWLSLHMQALLKEYNLAYAKQHELTEFQQNVSRDLNAWAPYQLTFDNYKQRTPFVNSAANMEKGIYFKHWKNTTAAYRAYLNARWKTDKLPVTWQNRVKPGWAEV